MIGMRTTMGTTRLEEENERLKEVNRQLTADYTRSLERLKSDCIQIDELKAEVKELKAERNRYAETLAKYQMASDKEIVAQVKQAKIDLLKDLIDGYGQNYISHVGLEKYKVWRVLKEIIEELQND